jgi:hypothetical protein
MVQDFGPAMPCPSTDRELSAGNHSDQVRTVGTHRRTLCTPGKLAAVSLGSYSLLEQLFGQMICDNLGIGWTAGSWTSFPPCFEFMESTALTPLRQTARDVRITLINIGRTRYGLRRAGAGAKSS